MVAECGATDALIAYPLIGPNIRRFFELQKSYPNTRFWAIGDDLKQAEYLGNMACAQQEEVYFLVDVNMGTNRTGVEIEKLQEFYENCDKLPGLKVMGMHCYDGNHGIEDYGQRKEAVDTVNHKVIEIVKILEAEGYDCSVMVMGGTPSFPCHALYDKLYLSPGTGVISDFGYSQRFKDEKFIPAGILLTRVVSHAKAGYFTLDLGYKGIASDPVGLRGSIVGIEYAESIGQNEEHWIWKMQDGHEEERPAIGEALYVIPTHICPTSALYPDVLVARNGEIVDKWEVTARNRKLTI